MAARYFPRRLLDQQADLQPEKISVSVRRLKGQSL